MKVTASKIMKLSKKGERGNALTIPNPMLRFLGIETGDYVKIVLYENELRLIKVSEKELQEHREEKEKEKNRPKRPYIRKDKSIAIKREVE